MVVEAVSEHVEEEESAVREARALSRISMLIVLVAFGIFFRSNRVRCCEDGAEET